ncbi:hypothetical protein [Rossellomorea marisflavi]|uniref:hypothetical protein n=1 Tax=Rossellomorea marisflavi TaxID=189381 RepID=UPI003FA04C21
MFTDNQNLFGTNLDGNMVVLPQRETLGVGVVQVLSDLFEQQEQFYKVKKVEENKPLHGGRKPEFSFEKNRLELVPLKGVQVLTLENQNTDGYAYEVPGESWFSYLHDTPIRKNQPVLIRGILYMVEDVEKTGKKSGVLKVSNYPLINVLQHLYVDNRWSKKNGRFKPVGLCETHRDFVLRRLTHPEKDPE